MKYLCRSTQAMRLRKLSLKLHSNEGLAPSFRMESTLNPTPLKVDEIDLNNIKISRNYLTHITLLRAGMDECIEVFRQTPWAFGTWRRRKHTPLPIFIIQHDRLRSLSILEVFAPLTAVMSLPSLGKWRYPLPIGKAATDDMIDMLRMSSCRLKKLDSWSRAASQADVPRLLQSTP